MDFKEYRVKQMKTKVFEFNKKLARVKNNFGSDKDELPEQSSNSFFIQSPLRTRRLKAIERL